MFYFKKSTKIQLAHLPLRIQLREVQERTGVTVLIGRVKAGVLKPGTNVTLPPIPTKAQIKWVEANCERVEDTLPGDVEGFNDGNFPDKL